ncbi:hypothetical protein DRQ07_08650 [candidate division KSB1 bacterium]|nr:MAG: hypothetical protein DRQ07_08650 [candidate division KSB1 bacterium]
MSIKQAAEELLKVADEIEKEAAEVTEFVCDQCNHTATLALINEKRREAAKQAGENVTVSEITVNDSVNCPACDGIMTYRPTEASEEYYIDEDKATKDNDESKEASESLDYDSLQKYLN